MKKSFESNYLVVHEIGISLYECGMHFIYFDGPPRGLYIGHHIKVIFAILKEIGKRPRLRTGDWGSREVAQSCRRFVGLFFMDKSGFYF